MRSGWGGARHDPRLASQGVPGYPEPPPASAAAAALIKLRAASKRSVDKRSPDKGQKDGGNAATSAEAGALRALKPRRLAT